MEINLTNKAVFVLHVKKGYEDREQHIKAMLQKMNIPFSWILDGDIADLTPEILDKYFAGDMHKAGATASCAYKHVLAYKDIIAKNLDGALILEDDIQLDPRLFIGIFNKSLTELNSEEQEPSIISYEDTRLRFVPKSKRVGGKVLYPGDRDRMAGAYYINKKGAELIINELEKQAMEIPVDWYHAKLLHENKLKYYWCQPTIATQGSHIGTFKSSISIKDNLWITLKWRFKRFYKKWLYELR